MREKLAKLGPLGAILTAAACPVCFPKLALVGAFFGLGALTRFEGALFIMTQVLVLALAIGYLVHYRRDRNRGRLALVLVSALIFFLSLYVVVNEYLSYASLVGLAAAAAWLAVDGRRACAVP